MDADGPGKWLSVPAARQLSSERGLPERTPSYERGGTACLPVAPGDRRAWSLGSQQVSDVSAWLASSAACCTHHLEFASFCSSLTNTAQSGACSARILITYHQLLSSSLLSEWLHEPPACVTQLKSTLSGRIMDSAFAHNVLNLEPNTPPAAPSYQFSRVHLNAF